MAVHGIHDFYNQAVKSQFLRDFNFRLLALNTHALSLTSEEIIYAVAKQLPERDITNNTVSFMGQEINVAGSSKYPGSDAYEIEFFMDAQGSMRQKLERASRTIFNDKYSTGSYAVPGLDNIISLGLIDPKLEIMTIYNLVGAQFRNIGVLEMDYLDGTGDLVKCNCTVSYQWYTVSDSSDDINVVANS